MGIAFFWCLVWFPIFRLDLLDAVDNLSNPTVKHGEFFTWSSRTLLRTLVEAHDVHGMYAFEDDTPPLKKRRTE